MASCPPVCISVLRAYLLGTSYYYVFVMCGYTCRTSAWVVLDERSRYTRFGGQQRLNHAPLCFKDSTSPEHQFNPHTHVTRGRLKNCITFMYKGSLEVVTTVVQWIDCKYRRRTRSSSRKPATTIVYQPLGPVDVRLTDKSSSLCLLRSMPQPYSSHCGEQEM